jgi:hypothetical protein
MKNFPAVITLSLFGLFAVSGHADPLITLGTAGSFAVLSGSTVTNTGPTVISGGDVGVSPGNAITGFLPGTISAPGTTQAGDAVASQAQLDLITAYNSAAGQAPTQTLTGQNLGGLTLTPGVYFFSSSAQLTGDLTLNFEDLNDADIIFQIGTTLTTASNSAINIINQGDDDNVYYQVGSSATLGTGTTLYGDILALTSITLNTGANISCGSALARNGAVTLDSNGITDCSASGSDIGGSADPTAPPAVTPEPATFWLLSTGLLGGVGALRRRLTV